MVRSYQTEFVKGAAQRVVLWLAKHVINADDMERDIMVGADPIAKRLHEHVTAATSSIKSPYHSAESRKIAITAEFILMTDTAYRELRDDVLRRIATDPLFAAIPPADPSQFFVNVVHDHNENSGGQA